MNVIGSRPDGWWRDRDGAKRRLAEELDRSLSGPVTLFLDGKPIDLPDLRHLEVEFAPGGPNAADEAIKEYVRAAPEPAELRVVTSDRPLAAAVRSMGAEVVGSGEFRRGLES